MNGDELGIDCGGAKCKKCNGVSCTAASECKSGICTGAKCVVSRKTGNP